jgi:murein tripeptide amidase MpaA
MGYVTYDILRHKDSSHGLEGCLEKYDFYIFPFANPDGMLATHSRSLRSPSYGSGFVYTQSRDRLWRKNRQPTGNPNVLGWKSIATGLINGPYLAVRRPIRVSMTSVATRLETPRKPKDYLHS